ncbi:MAG TPA: DUF58 domain-containing protein, partial [Actinomycetota bacterium]|nr:DUF58 domain-containing protein [Actinomycetota bacterium]
VKLTFENLSQGTTPFLLLEDAVPSELGHSARLVVTGIPSRNRHAASYALTARRRGRYHLGPLTIYVTDPFGLARTRVQSHGRSELVVYPEVEFLDASHLLSQGVGSGESTARQLHRSAADFYTMREYVTGDDLRRIHWPSVARTGQLMIRQDESTRRSTATVFLDNRSDLFGQRGSEAFERAVSVAASLGVAFVRSGFAVHFATSDGRPHAVTEDTFLEAMAGVGLSQTRGTATILKGLRAGGLADTTLAFVTAPPLGADLPSFIRMGTSFGRKLAVFIYPVSPTGLTPSGRSEIETRASTAKASLMRAGWEVYVLAPDGRLGEIWQRTNKTLRAGASSSA